MLGRRRRRLWTTWPRARSGGGNYLLNIGPEPDGSIPPETTACLEAVGKWLETNGKAIYGTERVKAGGNVNANYTRRGNTLYIHQHYWPGHTPAAEWLSFYQPEVVVAIGGLEAEGAVGEAAQDRAEGGVHAG